MLKHLFGFSSRSNRAEFLFWLVMLVIICLPVSSLLQSAGQGNMLALLAQQILSIIICWFDCALIARRLHDFDWSGWWALLVVLGLPFLIIIGIFVVLFTRTISFSFVMGVFVVIYAILNLVLMIIPGTPGENRFGTCDKHYYPAFMDKRAVFNGMLVLWVLFSIFGVYNGSRRVQEMDTIMMQLQTEQQQYMNQIRQQRMQAQPAAPLQ